MKINKYATIFLECMLVVFLIYFVLFTRVNVFSNASLFSGKIHLAVFLLQGQQSPEVIAEKIRAIDNFGSMEFISREKTMDSLAEMKSDIMISGENPFPDAYRVIPARKEPAAIEVFAAGIKSIKGVDEVRYNKDLVMLAYTLGVSKIFIDIVLKAAAVILLALLVVSITGRREFVSREFLNSIDYFYAVWGTAGSIAGIAIFAAIYNLILKNMLINLRPGKIFVIFAAGVLFSIVKTLNNAGKPSE